MKKTYISPETIVVHLMPTTIIAESQNINSVVGNGTQYTKENVGGDEGGSSTSSTNVWDEEW